MQNNLCFSLHRDCRICTETVKRGFRYAERKAGEILNFDRVSTYTIVFMLEGQALASCNEFVDIPIKAGEIALWPINSSCSWESMTNTSAIILETDNDLLLDCDKKALRDHAHMWLNAVPDYKGLPIRPRMSEYLQSIKNYLLDGISCPQMHKIKQRELSLLLRAYYTPEELLQFFMPVVRNNQEFELFVMENYLKAKGVKEFVDLLGMNLSTFNRKFKAHFHESPYQWLIKQKSKHIYYALTSTNKNLSAIAKEYHFSDASHFNRYCKALFGDSPSKIRLEASNRKLARQLIPVLDEATHEK